MARRHWRFIVRDRYGYTIQNARVNVYQPGTSTSFTGTAYNAASGGSAITNPFTTNQYGEVEAWFDTDQVVDVEVSDNTDTAYRAVDGPGGAFSFTTFREADEISAQATDIQTDAEHHVVGTTTDLQDITAALQAEVAGASGRWADGAHVHGHVAFAADPHGAAQHTNITRAIWLPINDGVVLDGGTLGSLGTLPNTIRTIALADAATQGALWTLDVPDDWASGTIDVTIFFAGATTTTGSVRWEVKTAAIENGTDITQAADVTTTFTGAAPTTANLLVKEALAAGSTPAAAGDLYRIGVRRLGADGADNYAAVAHLIGVLITYTANQ